MLRFLLAAELQKKKTQNSDVGSFFRTLPVTTEAYLWGFWSTHGVYKTPRDRLL